MAHKGLYQVYAASNKVSLSSSSQSSYSTFFSYLAQNKPMSHFSCLFGPAMSVCLSCDHFK